jgi:hypothetical protein
LAAARASPVRLEIASRSCCATSAIISIVRLSAATKRNVSLLQAEQEMRVAA